MDVSIPVISATKAIENKVAKTQQKKRESPLVLHKLLCYSKLCKRSYCVAN